MNTSSKTRDKQINKSVSEDSVPSFIRKTYEILEEGACNDIIRWSDDGIAIIISNPTEFAQKILPLYFKHNNLTSFIRQLNMYDFHKKRGLNMDNVYCHELFQKGKKHMLKEIRRKNSSDITAPSTDKTVPVLENTQAKQDLAVVVHENILLKTYNHDANSRVTILESKLNEMAIENQALWNQIYQFKEKENVLKNVIVNCIQQSGLSMANIPPLLQSELEFLSTNVKGPHDIKDNSPPFTAQTTTKMFFPSNSTFPQTFIPIQQDLQKSIRTVPTQIPQAGEIAFSIGTINPSFDFSSLKSQNHIQNGLNDPKLFPISIEPNRSMQGIGPWNLGLENFKSGELGNLRFNKSSAEENQNPQCGKRHSEDGEEKDSMIKKQKLNPLSLSDANLREKMNDNLNYMGQVNGIYQTNGGNLRPTNMKNGGLSKETI